MKRRSTSSDAGARQRRQRVAAETARLLAAGAGDPAAARRRAAALLGIDDAASLPGGEEIRDALASHRRLFGGTDPELLFRQREAALAAMTHFADFAPKLVGDVLEGTSAGHSAIELHLHADDPDSVARMLAERGAPAAQRTRSLRLGRGRATGLPCWELEAGGLPFALWVLPRSSARQAPLDALDDMPMRRADAAALRRLLGKP